LGTGKRRCREDQFSWDPVSTGGEVIDYGSPRGKVKVSGSSAKGGHPPLSGKPKKSNGAGERQRRGRKKRVGVRWWFPPVDEGGEKGEGPK